MLGLRTERPHGVGRFAAHLYSLAELLLCRVALTSKKFS